jgi:hypothetical protein
VSLQSCAEVVRATSAVAAGTARGALALQASWNTQVMITNESRR